MSDDRRRLLRRRLLAIGLLPLLLALALCLKVGVMTVLDERGRSAFADGELERAGDAFGANGRLNVFEPWVSPFDEGTADYALADYPRAKRLLEEALLVVPEEKECLVRINLALTHEALGDVDLTDGRRDLAQAAWREGIAVLDEGSCRGRSAPARSVAARLADKLADRADAETTEPEQTDPPTLEELEQRNEEAQEQRRKNEETREDEPPVPPEEPDEGEGTPPPSYSW
jgi:tetratricopeptide (TPR) repeat protein